MSAIEDLCRDAVARFNKLPLEEQRKMRRLQRKSWVMGEMMIEHPEMTRDEAETLFENLGL